MEANFPALGFLFLRLEAAGMEEFLQDAHYHSSGAFTLESPAQLESVRRLSNQSPWRWLEFALQGAVASRAQAAKIVVSPDSVEVLVLFESHQLSLQVGSQSGLPCVQDSTGVSSKFFHLAVLWGRCSHQNRVEESFQGKLSGFLRNFGKDGQLLDYSTLEESISPQWKLKLHLPDPCDRVQLEKLIERTFRYAFLRISVNHVPIRRNLNLKDALLLHWDFSDEGPRSHQICAPAIDLAWPYFLINSCDVRTRLDIRSDQVVRISGKLSDRQDD